MAVDPFNSPLTVQLINTQSPSHFNCFSASLPSADRVLPSLRLQRHNFALAITSGFALSSLSYFLTNTTVSLSIHLSSRFSISDIFQGLQSSRASRYLSIWTSKIHPNLCYVISSQKFHGFLPKFLLLASLTCLNLFTRLRAHSLC